MDQYREGGCLVGFDLLLRPWRPPIIRLKILSTQRMTSGNLQQIFPGKTKHEAISLPRWKPYRVYLFSQYSLRRYKIDSKGSVTGFPV